MIKILGIDFYEMDLLGIEFYNEKRELYKIKKIEKNNVIATRSNYEIRFNRDYVIRKIAENSLGYLFVNIWEDVHVKLWNEQVKHIQNVNSELYSKLEKRRWCCYG